MPTTINGTTGISQVQDGIVTPSDLSGNQTGNAPAFAARAWCLFNGATAGTNAPIAGGNVASVTKNSTGNWTITFTTPMPDANYAVIALCKNTGAAVPLAVLSTSVNTAAACNISAINFGGGTALDCEMHVAVFR